MKIKCALFTLLFLTFSGCNYFGAGTLGGFDNRTFATSKTNLERTIDTLYSINPDLKIPDKWKDLDNWSEQGYDFLESRIFYFKNEPEEMYYVTFIGDSTMLANLNEVTIAIRAVNIGNGTWKLEEDFNQAEKNRIQRRFDAEVTSKLKKLIVKI